VLTTYVVSNAIVLPISEFLVSWLGRKRFFLTCIVLFTLSSFFCGIAPSLGLLLLFRVMQGAFGGRLQPMAQAILADTFPPAKRGLAFASYGTTLSARPPLVPRLEAGSLTTIPGAGFSTSMFPWEFWPSCSSI
jgi:DHA2 family multidrug resistance protein